MATQKQRQAEEGEQSPSLALAEPPKAIIFRRKQNVAVPGGVLSFDPNVVYRDPSVIHHAIANRLVFDEFEEGTPI